jgi:ubiquinone/menaquinone biosynthesis C-methylase UbiE
MSKRPDNVSTSQGSSTTGLSATETSWLDVHFEACRPEYEEMLQSVGFQPGWHVLDGGCGSGGFLPLLSELVGPDGAITAVDFDAYLIAVVEDRMAASSWPCPITTVTASLTKPLPFPDSAFDALWCANTTQYFTDEELAQTLAEYRRIIRPGGLVAIKEYDACLERWRPGDPAVRWKLLAARAQEETPGGVQVRGMLRAGVLRRWLERAGLEQVWQRTVPIERWAPLKPAEITFLSRLSQSRFSIDRAKDLKLSASELAFLRANADPAAPEHPLNDPEFHYCETSVVAVGRVPEHG